MMYVFFTNLVKLTARKLKTTVNLGRREYLQRISPINLLGALFSSLRSYMVNVLRWHFLYTFFIYILLIKIHQKSTSLSPRP